MRHPFFLAYLTWGLLLGLAPAASQGAFHELGVRLVPAEDLRPLEALSTQQRLARIDSLESGWDDLAKDQIDQRRVEIGRLYASSKLVKHRVQATKELKKSSKGRGATLAARRTLATTYERFHNFPEAIRTLRALVRAYPDSAAAHRALGRALVDQCVRRWQKRTMLDALKSFQRAASCTDARPDDLIGQACALLMLDRREDLDLVGKRLLAESASPSAAAYLYAAVGAEGMGRTIEAGRLFRKGFEQLDSTLAAWFFSTEGYFHNEDGPFETPSLLGPPDSPASLVRWWVRLIETDAFFGRPSEGVYGWNTVAGQVYLRWGRPRLMEYRDANTVNARNLQRQLDLTHLDLSEIQSRGMTPGNPGFWLWVYELEDREFPIVFEKGRATAPWKVAPRSMSRFVEVREDLPLHLPQRPLRPEELDLRVRYAAFHAPGGRVRVEAYVALTSPDQDLGEGDLFRVRLRVIDSTGGVVDELTRTLDHSYRRREQMQSMGTNPHGGNTVLTQFGADLAPGAYAFALDAEDLRGGDRRSHEKAFRIGKPGDGLQLSDLELCDAFDEYSTEMALPPPFVKFARAVIPHPEPELSADQQYLSLYYEVYGAELDEDGNARLAAIYEVFNAETFYAFDVGRPAGEAPIPPLVRAEFPEEVAGVSASGMMVRGTRLFVGDLAAGEYVLTVSLSDRLAREGVQRFVRFHK